MQSGTGRLRIAALADIHHGNSGRHPSPVFTDVAAEADVLLLCGDLTDHGMPEEALGLVKELSGIKIPILAVLGNHDYHSNRQDEVRQILADGGVTILDGEAIEVGGVGFAGAKGFAGGFGRRTLGPWGEGIVKAFVQEAVDESLKLESALASLRTPSTVALLHYSPIEGTVEGEPPEIFPFLGCSRLEEPLNRYGVAAAFHGHAHRGSPRGATQTGIPVFNVSLPLLRAELGDATPVRRFEVEVTAPASPDGGPPNGATAFDA